MADNQQQQIDHYDFINAPQFVDFSDLAAQDDPDADKFFETHREEDDFMIPLDVNTISPTVQLLYDEESVHYSTEANKAAMAAGLPDVKIEYYSSPQQPAIVSQPSSANKKSVCSMYGTPLGASGLSSQSTGSFYTPSGEGEDKENMTPSSGNESVIWKSEKGGSESASKRSQRSVLDEYEHNDIDSNASSSAGVASGNIRKTNESATTESLMSRLDQLLIVSSDEEENEMLTLSYDNNMRNSNMQKETAHATIDEVTYRTSLVHDSNASNSQDVNEQFNQFASHYSSDSDSNDESVGGPMELGSPVNKILKILETQLRDDDENEDPRCSIVVAPRVGEQVHWSADAGDSSGNNFIASVGQVQELHFGFKTDEAECNGESYDGSNESTLDFYRYDNALGQTYQNRASSVGDLTKAIELEPRERQFETFGYNPRVGITIPKTPDVATVTQDELKSYNSNHNACYFEIEAPKPLKSTRRVSSCSDLLSLQKTSKLKLPVNRSQKASSKGLTVPKTPDTLKRSQKTHLAYSTASNESTTSHLSIRANNGVKTGPTVAERLASARNRQPMKGNHYVSLAEAMIKFQKSTPDRFRSLPKGRMQPEKRASSCDSNRRTGPPPTQSPDCTALTNKARADSFSEKKCNTTTGPALPKKVELKTTIPKPFNLSSTHRTRTVTSKPKEDVTDFKFKARPVPSNVLQDNPVLHKLKPHVKVTQPVSPHFASDARLKERYLKQTLKVHKSPDPKQGKPVVKPNRFPPAVAKSNHSVELKTTVAQAFSSSFEARQKEVIRRKEEKIKQELDEAKKSREFHANPVPKFTSKLPKKKSVETTHVEPFQLKSDARGAAYQEMFKKKLEEEEQLLKEQAKFHAQPANVIHKPPFEPERPTRIIEGAVEFNLATEKRAAEREYFEEQIRQKEREEEERRREEHEKQEELQRLEDIERRRQMVHKAQPFKAPKPFQPKASAKPLTVPQSPAFSAMPSERRIKPHSPQSHNNNH